MESTGDEDEQNVRRSYLCYPRKPENLTCQELFEILRRSPYPLELVSGVLSQSIRFPKIRAANTGKVSIKKHVGTFWLYLDLIELKGRSIVPLRKFRTILVVDGVKSECILTCGTGKSPSNCRGKLLLKVCDLGQSEAEKWKRFLVVNDRDDDSPLKDRIQGSIVLSNRIIKPRIKRDVPLLK